MDCMRTLLMDQYQGVESVWWARLSVYEYRIALVFSTRSLTYALLQLGPLHRILSPYGLLSDASLRVGLTKIRALMDNKNP